MKTLLAFVVIISFISIFVSVAALTRRRFRRKGLQSLGISAVVFAVSISMQEPTNSREKSAEPVPATLVASSSAEADPSTPEASRQAGTARICLSDKDIHLSGTNAITIPSTAVFEDKGPLSGQRDDPSSLTYEVKEGVWYRAAFVTQSAVSLTEKDRCATVQVKMIVMPLATSKSQKVSENHIFGMTDVLDYPIPARRPPIEFGKLVDDISIKAILLTDVTAWTESQSDSSDTEVKSAQCLEGAKKLAAAVGAGVGRQTSMVVMLGNVPASEASFGCAFGPKNSTDLFVAWSGHAQPPPPTKAFIAKAGEYLIGATQTELNEETAACISAALKPDAGELAEREFRGARIECQAFTRDGGGGSVTVYRRFGAYPVRPQPDLTALDKMNRASEKVRSQEERSANDAMKFAEWFQDPSAPKEVKTFAMMAARVISLQERCPTSKRHADKIGEWAKSAGIDTSEIQPGGQYFTLMVSMLATMRKGASSQSVTSACSDLKRYD